MANKKNYAASTVATAPSPATSGTSITVKAGEGAYFPPVPFSATLAPVGQITNLGTAEKVLVTARPGNADTFTITRAQDSTTAKTVAVGWVFANSIFTEDLGGVAIQPDAPTDTSLLWYDTDDDSAPAAGGNSHMVDGFHASQTPAANTLLPLDANSQVAAKSAPAIRQSGWDYVNITVSGSTQTKTVTFPVPFATAPSVIVTPWGWTTGTVAGPQSFTGDYAQSFALSYNVYNITTTGFTVKLTAASAFGVSKSGFGWIAEAV